MLLFVLVIALVLLSYFVERSRDSDALALFRSEHMTRLSRVEQRLDTLETQLDALSQSLDAAQVQLKAEADAQKYAGDKSIAELRAEIETLKTQLTAVEGEMDKLLEEIGSEE